MSILFDCPFCSYEKEVPDSYEGKKIKCPRCLATLTLGIPQPTTVTDLPLPEDNDESQLDTQAIEVDEQDTLIECPICLALINSNETQCPAYKSYLEQSAANEQAESKALEEYQKAKARVKKNFFLALASLLPGIGILLGPLAISQAKGIIPLLCENLEMENRHKVNRSILLGFIGIIGSLFSFIGLAKWVM